MIGKKLPNIKRKEKGVWLLIGYVAIQHFLKVKLLFPVVGAKALNLRVNLLDYVLLDK
jgi:hypothetical protein